VQKIYLMKAKIYLQEVYKELTQNVSWPTWAELQSSALVVMVASSLIAIAIFCMDKGFGRLMDTLYGMFY